MRMGRITWASVLVVAMVVLAGCISEEQYNDLKFQNRVQQQRISDLESELGAANLMLSQLQAKLKTCEEKNALLPGAKDEEIAALEKTIAEQKALIEKLNAQLLKGPSVLPPLLNEQLRKFADSSDMVEFDEAKGMLKFKSDVLFASGSAQVSEAARGAIKSLAQIMASPEAKNFDIIIAGHTDDQPIRYSKAQHPTNWHLSAHRAIGVLQELEKDGVAPQRMSIRGFGEYRPAAPNQPGNKGNPANRRVEVYIVAAGS